MTCVGYFFMGRYKFPNMVFLEEYIVRFKNIGSCD